MQSISKASLSQLEVKNFESEKLKDRNKPPCFRKLEITTNLETITNLEIIINLEYDSKTLQLANNVVTATVGEVDKLLHSFLFWFSV